MSQKQGKSTQRLGIVADDLTGAMDSSGYFARMGLSTEVVLEADHSSDADVIVVTTSSRAEQPDVARESVRQAVRRMAGRTVYKKIDSTLRGNIGVELLAAMEEAGCEKAIVAPAFPAVGRTTRNGVLLVDGVPVAETQFANDPVSPVSESHIPTLLEETTGRRIRCLGIERIETGIETLYDEINGTTDDVVVCDIEEQSHLQSIVRAAALAKGRWLLCGSGGMARELHHLLGGKVESEQPPSAGLSNGPALAVIGSRNQVVVSQIEKGESQLQVPVLSLQVEHLQQGNGSSGEVSRVVREANRLLAQGKSLVLTSALSQYVPDLKWTIPPALAEAVENIVSSHKLGGLFLSGGDIAVAVCRRLSVSAIRVRGEVEPGIPAGEAIGGQSDGTRVVTKAGGFGTADALVKSIMYLEKGYLT